MKMEENMVPYVHRVQYYETDQMGIIHHSNYIRWMEEARTDFLEQAGWGYAKLEQLGVISPVLAVDCRYKEMTKFYDQIVIWVWIKELKGVRLVIGYKMAKRDNGHIVLEGATEHCFLDRGQKPVRLKKILPGFYQTLTELAEKGAPA